MNQLMNEKALRARLMTVYGAMQQRAKPRYYKSGRRKGQARVPGIDKLPFTRDQFYQHAQAQIGPTGAVRCPYCMAIGKNANVIDMVNCVFDHKAPLGRAGAELTLEQTWSLRNLVAICADCNNLKGKLGYDFFIALMRAIEEWPDTRDRAGIYACMRTHGVTLRNFGRGKGKAGAVEPEPQEATPLALDF